MGNVILGAGLSVLFSVVALFCTLIWRAIFDYHEVFGKNKAVEAEIKLGNKVWCRYVVAEASTREPLVFGSKYRSFNDLPQAGSIRITFGGRKIFIYESAQVINGICCLVTFYANEKKDKDETRTCIIEPKGEELLFFSEDEGSAS